MTTVIKLGARVQGLPDLAQRITEAWDASGRSLCIVHGGGDEISMLQRQVGREPSFVNGRRVTTAEDMELARMVLSGRANKALVASLVAAGLHAVGISGEDASLILAETIGQGLGRAGKPVRIDPQLLHVLLAAGYLPVISPVSRDCEPGGAALNVNGDDAAAAIAGALNADLWLISDVRGVLNERGGVETHLDAGQLESLVTAGVVNHGMRAKLEAGFAALSAGARSVRVGQLDALGSAGCGTTLTVASAIA